MAKKYLLAEKGRSERIVPFTQVVRSALNDIHRLNELLLPTWWTSNGWQPIASALAALPIPW